MNEKTELLPCPFCGGEPRCVDLAGWEIHCDCGAQLWRARPDRDALVEHWNARIDFGTASPSSKSTKELSEQEVDDEWMRWNLPVDSGDAMAFYRLAEPERIRKAFQDGLGRGLALASSSTKEDGGGGEPCRVGWFVFTDGEWRQTTRHAEGALPLYEIASPPSPLGDTPEQQEQKHG